MSSPSGGVPWAPTIARPTGTSCARRWRADRCHVSVRMEDDRSRRLKIDLFEWERCDESARESCDHHGARCRQRHALPGYRANADPTHTRVRERRSRRTSAGARRSSLPGRRSSRRVRRWPGGLSWAAGRVSRPRAHPGLAERPEIQDDERNDPGQNNRAHDEQDAQDDVPRIRTCPPGQPPDERCQDSDKQSVATAGVWANERRDTDERPCDEGYSLRRARSWCALAHRREGFYRRPHLSLFPDPGRLSVSKHTLDGCA